MISLALDPTFIIYTYDLYIVKIYKILKNKLLFKKSIMVENAFKYLKSLYMINNCMIFININFMIMSSGLCKK